MELNVDGIRVINTEEWLQNQYGRLRDVIQAKDGSIFISTSNMDGRGSIVYGGDKIIKLIPKNLL